MESYTHWIELISRLKLCVKTEEWQIMQLYLHTAPHHFGKVYIPSLSASLRGRIHAQWGRFHIPAKKRCRLEKVPVPAIIFPATIFPPIYSRLYINNNLAGTGTFLRRHRFFGRECGIFPPNAHCRPALRASRIYSRRPAPTHKGASA